MLYDDSQQNTTDHPNNPPPKSNTTTTMNIISMKMRNPMPFLITTLPVTMSILSALVHGFSRDCYHPGRMGRIIARSAAASTTTVANAPALSGVSLLSPSASSSCTTQSSMPSSTALFGVRNRGLEQNREGATPTGAFLFFGHLLLRPARPQSVWTLSLRGVESYQFFFPLCWIPSM